jgi:hypothetical protein
MRTTRLIRIAGVAAAVAAVPILASAQLAGKLVFTPFVGAYTPTTDVIRDNFVGGGTTVAVSGKHQSAFATGATASYWLSDRVAIEGGAMYSRSGLKGNALMNEAGNLSASAGSDRAHIWTGSAKLMFQLLPPENGFNARLGVGPAFITRGGTAYEGDSDGSVSGLTNVGGVVSLCTRIPVTSVLGVRLRTEDYIYRSRLGWNSNVAGDPSFRFGARTQHDFVFSAGLQVSVNP